MRAKLKLFNTYPKRNLLTFYNGTKVYLENDKTCRVIFYYTNINLKFAINNLNYYFSVPINKNTVEIVLQYYKLVGCYKYLAKRYFYSLDGGGGAGSSYSPIGLKYFFRFPFSIISR